MCLVMNENENRFRLNLVNQIKINHALERSFIVKSYAEILGVHTKTILSWLSKITSDLGSLRYTKIDKRDYVIMREKYNLG